MKNIQILLIAFIATFICAGCKSNEQKRKEREQKRKQIDMENAPLYRDKFVGVWIIGRMEKKEGYVSDTLTIIKQQDGLLYVSFSTMMVPVKGSAWLNQNGAVDGKEKNIIHDTSDTSFYYLWIKPANPNDKNKTTNGYGYQYTDDGLCLVISSKDSNNLTYNSGVGGKFQYQYYRNK